MTDVVQEMFSRFDSGIMAQAAKDKSIYITEANTPMVFFRYLPNDEAPLPTPF